MGLAARVAGAVTAVPGVAYLSPNARNLLNLFNGSGDRNRGVYVHADESGCMIEIRVALLRSAHALTTTRAVRDAADKAVSEGDDAPTEVRITVTVTVIA
jgi:uncharacterized alkaline shock family protein YloU